jgi:hypothetical protein
MDKKIIVVLVLIFVGPWLIIGVRLIIGQRPGQKQETWELPRIGPVDTGQPQEEQYDSRPARENGTDAMMVEVEEEVDEALPVDRVVPPVEIHGIYLLRPYIENLKVLKSHIKACHVVSREYDFGDEYGGVDYLMKITGDNAIDCLYDFSEGGILLIERIEYDGPQFLLDVSYSGNEVHTIRYSDGTLIDGEAVYDRIIDGEQLGEYLASWSGFSGLVYPYITAMMFGDRRYRGERGTELYRTEDGNIFYNDNYYRLKVDLYWRIGEYEILECVDKSCENPYYFMDIADGKIRILDPGLEEGEKWEMVLPQDRAFLVDELEPEFEIGDLNGTWISHRMDRH